MKKTYVQPKAEDIKVNTPIMIELSNTAADPNIQVEAKESIFDFGEEE